MELGELEENYYNGNFAPLLSFDNTLFSDQPLHASYKLLTLTSQSKIDAARELFQLLGQDIGSDRLSTLVIYFVRSDFLLKTRDLGAAGVMLDKALSYYQALETVSTDEKRYFSRIIRLYGTLHVYQGDFVAATEQFSQAIHLAELNQDNNNLSRSYFNRAASLYWLGNIDDALVDGLKGWELIKDRKNTENYIGATNNIGLIYLAMNDPVQALSFFLKSLESTRNLGNVVYLALNYHNIVRAYLLLNDVDETQNYLTQFEQLDLDLPLIRLMYGVTKGMAMLSSTRLQSLAEGQRLLDEVIDSPVIDHQFTIMAIFTAIDYLLLELEKMNDSQILSDINDMLTKIDEIARNRAVRPAIIQGNLVRARIMLIQGDISGAKSQLNYAKELAGELGQYSMVQIIERELEDIEEHFNFWNSSLDQMPLEERTRTANLGELLKNIRYNQLVSKFETHEEPIFLIILQTSGMPIFTRKFKDGSKQVNEFLISGFLSAVNLFGRETFESGSEQLVDRLQFQGNEIILRKVDDIVFSYAFSGSSRNIVKRFMNFTDFIIGETGLDDYLHNRALPISIDNLPHGLERLIDQALNTILLN